MAESEEVVSQFRQLGPPTFGRKPPHLRADAAAGSRTCSIYGRAVGLICEDSFDSHRRVYHRECYSEVIKIG